MRTQNALNDCTHFGANAFLDGPFNGSVLPHRVNQFQSNLPQRFITQDFHCSVVHYHRNRSCDLRGSLILEAHDLATR